MYAVAENVRLLTYTAHTKKVLYTFYNEKKHETNSYPTQLKIAFFATQKNSRQKEIKKQHSF